MVFRSLLKTPKQPFGMMDDYTGKKQKKQFDEFMAMMTSKEQFTCLEYRMMIDDNVQAMNKGIMRKMFSLQDESKEELGEIQRVLHALLPGEMEDQRYLEMKNVQDEIATAAQVPIGRVAKVSQMYVQHKLLHSWIQKLIKFNQPLPLNMSEMMVRFRSEFKMSYQEKKEVIYQREKEKESQMKRQVQEMISKKRAAARRKRLPYRV